MRHPRRRDALRLAHRHARVDAVPPLHVLVVVGPVGEVVLALVAGVRPLPGVLAAVRRQHALEAEALAAELAREGHGAGVNTVVLLEGALFAKLPAADVALVRLQARVHRAVLAQAHERLEGFAARRAGEGPGGGVGDEVVVEVALLDEALAALVAGVVAHAGVDALVGHEVGLRAESARLGRMTRGK